jgi:hypothetical protein
MVASRSTFPSEFFRVNSLLRNKAKAARTIDNPVHTSVQKESLERVVLEKSLQQLKRSLQEITSWRAKAESESEKKNALKEQLKQLHVLRRRYVAAFEALKKAAEE